MAKKRILLIDDDTSLLVTLGDFLEFEGYEVVTASSGEEGLKKLKQAKPDLIILDMSMPGMGGIGFLKEISDPEGRPRHPVLVLTARANMAEFFANVEVDGFIAKPCAPEDLLMEVGRIIFMTSGTVSEAGGGKPARLRVLIGEDDKGNNQKLINAFAAAGFESFSAYKGAEVLERAIVEKPDVVVMKQILEGMNGDAVARMMREMPNTRDIPVVLYDDTGALEGVEEGGLSANIYTVVVNAEVGAVVAAVKEVMGRE